MNFKNDLEKSIFEASQAIFGSSSTIEHNKTLRIENALLSEVASFSGPPKKEIDVITVTACENPRIALLISCKDFSETKAEPAHVQEWAAVLNAMTKYSESTTYFGLVLSPSGFTSGCESWATSSNIALIPPLKGKSLRYSKSIVIKMFKRAAIALKKRLAFPYEELCNSPHFYDFVYNLTSDFEGFEEDTRKSGSRYFLLPNHWHSSFGELVQICVGKKVNRIICSDKLIGIQFDDDSLFFLKGIKIFFGTMPSFSIDNPVEPACFKNIAYEECDLQYINNLITGKIISSAGDFVSHFEFGIESMMNVSFYPDNRIHVISTVNPIKDNNL
ncbi:DUF2034 domain-containing protein [bacterium]|nr:DUF2034 domain-containing protein [bacterium]